MPVDRLLLKPLRMKPLMMKPPNCETAGRRGRCEGGLRTPFERCPSGLEHVVTFLRSVKSNL